MRKYKREWVARRRAQFFSGKACVKCGSNHRLELDHIDPSLKESHNIWSWSQKRRDEEIAKCQILCHDCHSEKTIAYNSRPYTHGSHEKGYSRGCRCKPCTDAHRQYNHNHRLKRRGLL